MLSVKQGRWKYQRYNSKLLKIDTTRLYLAYSFINKLLKLPTKPLIGETEKFFSILPTLKYAIWYLLLDQKLEKDLLFTASEYLCPNVISFI